MMTTSSISKYSSNPAINFHFTHMRGFIFVVLASLFLIVSSQLFEEQEKRSAMGGSAFGGLDRIPLSVLRKYYANHNQQKRALRNTYLGYGRSFSMG